jgi:UDP-N-acetylmuramoylalanine--D-glutamate ligase
VTSASRPTQGSSVRDIVSSRRGEIAVIGLARSGRAAARLLASRGSKVYASDASSDPPIQAASAALSASGVSIDVGRHDFDRIRHASLVVASPGVPPNAKPLATARAAGVPVVSEIEIGLLFLRKQRYIAITGTNGKTTTTTLTARLLEAAGRTAVAAGNIGTPLTEVALSEKPPQWIALEVSSFQLHDTPSIDPTIGILTNLSANHLDRYPSITEYYADKAQLFRNATPQSRWISNDDDPDSQQMMGRVIGDQRRFSLKHPADAWYDRASGSLVVLRQQLLKRAEFPLLGDHNVANALAASLAVLLADTANQEPGAVERIAEALRQFHALEHRIEPVPTQDGITWINDSKSTNVASTLVALQGMQRPTILLLGGRHKGEPYSSLAEELRRTVRTVIAYGEAGELVEKDLHGIVPVVRLGSSFDEVIAEARKQARPGDAVLLSPACSSYDMFDNYEERGKVFKTMVAER